MFDRCHQWNYLYLELSVIRKFILIQVVDHCRNIQSMRSHRVGHDWSDLAAAAGTFRLFLPGKWFYEGLQDLLELTPQKDVLFIIGDWNAKVGSQETPGVTGKFGLGIRNEVGQRLIEFCQENALVITNTLFQQHKRKLYTWTSPDGQHRNQIDYILCSQRWRSSI